MRRLSLAPLGGVALVLAEIGAVVALGNLIGMGWAVLLVFLMSLGGLWLLGREGGRTWRGFREAAAAGAAPGQRVTDGLVGLAGALLLALPGLLSGLAGLVLLTPPARRAARRRVQARAERRMSSAAAGNMFGPRRVRVHVHQDDPVPQGGDDLTADVVEGEVIGADDPRHRSL